MMRDREIRHHDRAEHHDGAVGEVDARRKHDDRLPDRERPNLHHLLQQLGHVAPGQEDRRQTAKDGREEQQSEQRAKRRQPREKRVSDA